MPELKDKREAEVRTVSVDLEGKLDAGETLTGTPTITSSPVGSVSAPGLTIDDEQVSTTVLTINDREVAIGQAVQFMLSDGTARQTYTITVQCGTSAGQTIETELRLRVV